MIDLARNRFSKTSLFLVLFLFIILLVGLELFWGLVGSIGTWDQLWQPQSQLHLLLIQDRLPKLLAALFAGSGFAVAGVILQAITRNPLASPTVLGINYGAALAMVMMLILFPNISLSLYTCLAFVGAVAATILTFGITAATGITPVRLALAGMVISIALQAATKTLIDLYPDEAQGAIYATLGNLGNISWLQVKWLMFWVTLGLVFVCFKHKVLDILYSGGEKLAQQLGIRQQRAFFYLMGIALVLCAAPVSIVGPISFIGLMIPNLFKALGFYRHRLLLPLSALGGAVMLLGADVFSEHGFASFSVPAGMSTVLIGCPLFIFILTRQKDALQ